MEAIMALSTHMCESALSRIEIFVANRAIFAPIRWYNRAHIFVVLCFKIVLYNINIIQICFVYINFHMIIGSFIMCLTFSLLGITPSS